METFLICNCTINIKPGKILHIICHLLSNNLSKIKPWLWVKKYLYDSNILVCIGIIKWLTMQWKYCVRWEWYFLSCPVCMECFDIAYKLCLCILNLLVISFFSSGHYSQETTSIPLQHSAIVEKNVRLVKVFDYYKMEGKSYCKIAGTWSFYKPSVVWNFAWYKVMLS